MAAPAVLIAYFSNAGQNYVDGKIVELPVGNTEVAAEKLSEITGARLVRIEQAQTYPGDYHELTEVAKKELRAGARPELKSAVPDMTGVDVLFLGYPNWWGTMPMPVWTFLDAIPTAGKAIAPFCTNEGSGMGRSEKDLSALCPAATIRAGLPIIGHKVHEAEALLRKWARDILA
ncbi:MULTISPECIES: flavodoxin [unclassified Desulfovibrio]|uniref:flavodoxin n=1 Tax=unclassified Desulfovibrio TaxID=2593640 RepID=UPI0013EA1C20|nr:MULTISPECIES: flavodoxin [unclassified Desulfovibrio]